MKHGDAPKLRSVWASVVTSLLHLTMISTNKHGVGFEDRLKPFSLYDASRSSLAILTKIGHAHFLTLRLWIGNRDGMCYMWTMFIWTFVNMT
jgi:hypothetical protein